MENNSDRGLKSRIRELETQLEEAKDTIDAIRLGQVDALVVHGENGHALYTLKTADHAYRIFIEKMTEGAVSLSPAGIIIYSNSMFSSMVRSPLTKVIGSSLRDFIIGEDQEVFDSVFERGWREDVKAEICLAGSDRNIPVQLSVNPLELDAGFSLNIILTDLTMQKHNEKILKEKNDQLESLNDALSKSNYDLQQFASIASHDLQEPLRKIQVFAKFLTEKGFDELSDESRQYVSKIFSSTNRMKALIVDILTYSRLSVNDLTTDRVDLRVLCEEILEDMELVIEEKDASIELIDLPSVVANKGQIRQVLNNLISNALKFSKTGVRAHVIIQRKPVDEKELGISLPSADRYCRISVKDNGIGFEQKFAGSIFNLFEMLNPKSTFEGSGIGLAIAKKIMDKHEGFIIPSSIPGVGSEFNIVIPYKRVRSNGN